MTTNVSKAASADFIKNLGRMYGTYTGGFIAFIVLLAILEMVGVPNKILGYLFVFFTLAVYAVIGVMTRTAEVSEYYVAGRRVPAFYNGMATGADWMSAASFVGMAGTLFLFGYVIHMFVNVLNQYTVPILKFPLGFYMAAQGSLIVFVVMLFMFARQQDKIDREHGVAEDD